MIVFNNNSRFIVLITQLLVWSTKGVFSTSDKIYKLERVGNCCENVSMSMDFSGLGKINERQSFRYTGAINVTNDVKGDLCMKIVIQKCNARGLHCEDFINKMFKDFCPLLLSNKIVADTLSESTVPSFKCPIKKGIYVASKHLADMSRVDMLPFDSKYKWVVTLDFFEQLQKSKKDEDKLRPLGCWLMQVSRTTVSNRKRG